MSNLITLNELQAIGHALHTFDLLGTWDEYQDFLEWDASCKQQIDAENNYYENRGWQDQAEQEAWEAQRGCY